MSINKYLADLEALIQATTLTASYTLSIDRKAEDLAFISGCIDFKDESVLDFKEFVEAVEYGINKLKYGYNYRRDAELIFRYDNAPDPRAKLLPSYPHHKHQSNGEIVASKEMELAEVLEEIETLVVRKRW